MWSKLSTYYKRYPARVSGYTSALILWAHKYFSGRLVELLVPSIVFMIGMGEMAQRSEDRKTIKAISLKQDINKTDEELIRGIE